MVQDLRLDLLKIGKISDSKNAKLNVYVVPRIWVGFLILLKESEFLGSHKLLLRKDALSISY